MIQFTTSHNLKSKQPKIGNNGHNICFHDLRALSSAFAAVFVTTLSHNMTKWLFQGIKASVKTNWIHQDQEVSQPVLTRCEDEVIILGPRGKLGSPHCVWRRTKFARCEDEHWPGDQLRASTSALASVEVPLLRRTSFGETKKNTTFLCLS